MPFSLKQIQRSISLLICNKLHFSSKAKEITQISQAILVLACESKSLFSIFRSRDFATLIRKGDHSSPLFLLFDPILDIQLCIYTYILSFIGLREEAFCSGMRKLSLPSSTFWLNSSSWGFTSRLEWVLPRSWNRKVSIAKTMLLICRRLKIKFLPLAFLSLPFSGTLRTFPFFSLIKEATLDLRPETLQWSFSHVSLLHWCLPTLHQEMEIGLRFLQVGWSYKSFLNVLKDFFLLLTHWQQDLGSIRSFYKSRAFLVWHSESRWTFSYSLQLLPSFFSDQVESSDWFLEESEYFQSKWVEKPSYFFLCVSI